MGSTDAGADPGHPHGDERFRVELLLRPAPAELEMLGRLVRESHWNQLQPDWELFLSQGRVIVVRDTHSGDDASSLPTNIVASGAVLPMDAAERAPQVAWISMILALPEIRGRGLGKQVFQACLSHAQTAGYLPMLDATPQGEPLYRQFGFDVLSHITRWKREAQSSAASQDDSAQSRESADSSGVSPPLLNPHLPDMISLDQQALGFGRRALLQSLQQRKGSCLLRHAGGFALIREGRTARHIGPVLAYDEDSALQLLQQAFASTSAAMLIDAPQDRPVLAQALSAAGFTPQRHFARMALTPPGHQPPAGEPRLLYAIAGPEYA